MITNPTPKLKKFIFSWTETNPVDPVSIWPEPDLKKLTGSTGTGTGFPVAHCLLTLKFMNFRTEDDVEH